MLVLARPVASLVTVTVAPGTNDPDGSLTNPEICPRSNWAKSAPPDSSTHSVAARVKRFITTPPKEPHGAPSTPAARCSWVQPGGLNLPGGRYLSIPSEENH